MDFSPFPIQDGIRLISPPQQFEGGEEEYDARIGGAQRADLLRCGHGAWRLVSRYATRPVETLLEIGAGGGTCSLGLMDAAPGVQLVITDTSPRFLQLVRRKAAAAALSAPHIQYATLAGEELHLLPPAGTDAIVIASALHHVGDWRAFLHVAARALRPGGVLAIQEPFREGNLMMAMGMDVALSPLWPAAAAFSAEDAAKLDACRGSIYFLANSHVEKQGEDKHNFLATELATAAMEAGFDRFHLFSNAHFQDLTQGDLERQHGACSLVAYMDSFLRDHHRLSAAGMEKLRQHLFPVMRRIDDTFRRGDGPPLLGCMVFRR